MSLAKTLPAVLATLLALAATKADAINGRSRGLRGALDSIHRGRKLQPNIEENKQLFLDAAIISKATYFIDEQNDTSMDCGQIDLEGEIDNDHCESYEEDVDAAAIVKYDGKCFVAFRGTRTPAWDAKSFKIKNARMSQDNIDKFIKDSSQNFDSGSVTKASSGCEYRMGFNTAYETMKVFIEKHLPGCRDTCGGSGCPVVLTGHSQGGAAAVVASFDTDPVLKGLFDDPHVITFGAPAAALTYNECELSINSAKHFRIVTSETDNNSLSCDPIPEHSKKKAVVVLPTSPTDSTKVTITEGQKEPTVHLGNTVLLNREKNGEFEIAHKFGDATCQNFEADEEQVLTNDDFGATSLLESTVLPLHHPSTYIRALGDVLLVGASDGLTENHVCTKNWQCDGNMVCEDGSNICKHPPNYRVGISYIDEVTYRGGMNRDIHLTYERPENVNNLVMQIVRPHDEHVLDCQTASNEFNIFFAEQNVDGVSGSVKLQLGEGTCGSFDLLSVETVEFNPNRLDSAEIIVQPTDGENRVCVKGWQCDDSMFCSTGYTCDASPRYIDEVTYKGGKNWDIYVSYEWPENVSENNLAMRLVKKDQILGCEQAVRDGDNYFVASHPNFPKFMGGSVTFELGTGSCDNFVKLSEETIDFNPNSPSKDYAAEITFQPVDEQFGNRVCKVNWHCGGDSNICDSNICVSSTVPPSESVIGDEVQVQVLLEESTVPPVSSEPQP